MTETAAPARLDVQGELAELAPEDYLQISENGNTLWVHGPDGSTVGRFDWRFGMDVHNTVAAQMEGAPQCLKCTHEPATEKTWTQFVAAMREHHSIVVPENIFAPEDISIGEKHGNSY